MGLQFCLLWSGAAGTEGVLYSDHLNGDTSRFKVLHWKQFKYWQKYFRLKQGKKKRQCHYAEIKITWLNATQSLISSILRRFTKITPNFMKRRLQTSERKRKSERKKQSLVYFLYQFSSVQSLSRVWLFATPWTAARQASLSTTNSWSPPKPMSNESVSHPTTSSSVVPFSSCPQSFPASGSFQMSQLFISGDQSIGFLASTSVLPMNTQDWSPPRWTGWIYLQSKGLSRVFSNTTVQKHQFFSAQLSSQSNSHIHTWPLEKP